MIPTRFVLTLSDCIGPRHVMRGRGMRGTCLQTGRREHKIPCNFGCTEIFRQGAKNKLVSAFEVKERLAVFDMSMLQHI